MAKYKILIPLDGSRLAEHSLAYVHQLAKLGEPDVMLLSVVDLAEEVRAVTPQDFSQRESNLLGTYLHEVANDFKEHLGITVTTKLAEGNPATQILAAAAEFAPDVLVIATHGRSGISRWRLGSVADKVIRGACSNTLVIGPKASERDLWMDADMVRPFKAVLVPLDGSVLGDRALPIAAEMAEKFDSELHLVRVVSLPVMGEDIGNVIDMLIEAAGHHLTEVAKRYPVTAGVKTKVLLGAASAVLDDYIEVQNVDLVVMTSHGRGGLARAALGSVTDRLLGGQAPVLVVRPKEA